MTQVQPDHILLGAGVTGSCDCPYFTLLYQSGSTFPPSNREGVPCDIKPTSLWLLHQLVGTQASVHFPASQQQQFEGAPFEAQAKLYRN
jgi:hypothetical protein